MEINKKLLLTVCLAVTAFSFLLAQLIKPGVEQLSNAISSNTVPAQEIRPGRWTFIKDPASSDALRKAAILKRIDQFWSDFKASQEKLKFNRKPGKSNATAIEWLSENLHKIDHRLAWEISPDTAKGTELDICAEGNQELNPIIATMLERAGTIPGWKFTGYRQPIEADLIESAFQARSNESLPIFKAQLSKTERNNIDVTVFSPDFIGKNRKEDLEKAFLLTDLILGEENVDSWVRLVYTKQDNQKKSSAAPFNSAEASASFAANFAKLKSEIQASLPTKHYFEFEAPKVITVIGANKEGFAESKKLERYRYTFVTPFERLVLSMPKHSLMNSDNFSKNHEKFVYLHVIPNSSDNFEKKREAIEENLDKLLRQKKLGCLIASGRGKPDSYYFDLCLSDVDRAIPELQNYCRSKKFPDRSWLRFYDKCWTYEWVEMLPTTPPLKNPELMW